MDIELGVQYFSEMCFGSARLPGW